MDLLGSLINAVVIAVAGIVLWASMTGRFTAQDARMDRLEESLGARIDRLEGRIDRLEESVNGRIDRLEESVSGRIDALRSDLTQVALAVGAKPRSESG